MRLRVLVAVVSLFPAAQLGHAQLSPPAAAAHKSSPQTAEFSAPLPDIHTLVARVRARYMSLENLRKSYIFTVTQVADEFSADGRKSTHTDQYQAFFAGDTELLQHLARDGRPLSPEAAQKEQRRIDKRIAEIKAHQQQPDKDSIRPSVSELLKVATFSNPRRELIDGRPTLVFDYKGDPKAEATDLSQQIMRHLAGTLWIDERDSAILRLNGVLQQNFRVAGGLLVNIKKGSWFDLTQTRVNSEIWFPKVSLVHVDGRFLLIKGFHGDAHDSFSDYRRMRTTVTILPGSRVVANDAAGGPIPSGNPHRTAPTPAGERPSQERP